MFHITVDTNRPVVFLDLDGVIAETWSIQQDWLWSREDRFKEKDDNGYLKSITVKAAHELLLDVLTYYNAQVIIVSSWLRSDLKACHKDIIEFKEFFGYDDVLGTLNTGGGKARGEEVKEFVIRHALKSWAVVDDSKEKMYLDQTFFNNSNFVQPCGRFGFWQKEAEHLSLILGGGSDWELTFHGMK